MLDFKKIDGSQSVLFYVIYFFTLCDTYLVSANALSNISLQNPASVQFPYLLTFFSQFEISKSTSVLLVLNLIIPLACLLFLKSQPLRILHFLLFLMTKGFIFSVWRMEHVYWPLMWILLFFALAPRIDLQEPQKRLTLLCIRGALLSVVIFYFYPGFWKVISGFKTGELFSLDYASNTVAYYLLSHGKKSLLGDFLVHSPLIALFGVWASILLQLSSIFCLFNERILRLWPFATLAFHGVNIFAVNINFLFAGIVACAIMWLTPKEALLRIRK